MPQRADPVQEVVAAEVRGDTGTIHRRLVAFFNDGRASVPVNRFRPDDRLHLFEAVPAQAPPELQQVQAPGDHVLAHQAELDPALQRYLSLDRRQRERDLYLYQPTGPHYWPSEYQLHDRPLPFSTDFIVHLQPVDSGHTRIEVIELMPRVQLGEKWAFARHGVGIGRVEDVRAVAPTTRDRLELLARIVEAVVD